MVKVEQLMARHWGGGGWLRGLPPGWRCTTAASSEAGNGIVSCVWMVMLCANRYRWAGSCLAPLRDHAPCQGKQQQHGEERE